MRNKILASFASLVLIASVVFAVAVVAVGIPTSSTIENHGIEGVIPTKSGYVVVMLSQHTVADTVVLSSMDGDALTAKPLTKSHESVLLAPVHDNSVTFKSAWAGNLTMTLPGALVPDSHPDSSVEVLNPGKYRVSLIANGTVTETETVNLTAETLENYTQAS